MSNLLPPIAAIRWAALAVGVSLAAVDDANRREVVVWGVILLVYTTWRTFRPILYVDDTASLVRVLLEVAVNVLAVSATGYWDSPYVFSLITAVIVAGFARGFGFALRIGFVSAIAVALPHITSGDDKPKAARLSAQWAVELLLVAIVAGYARRISTESARQHSLALDRLGRLAEANTLLYSLHRVAQTLPASLDLDEVLDSTMGRLRDLIEFDAATLLLYEETDETWVPVRREGNRNQSAVHTDELPPPLQRAMLAEGGVTEPQLIESGGPGLAARAESGLYAALRARGALIGLLAVESNQPRHFSVRDVELLNGLIEPLALAIDNARWFSRLRTIGADEERTRIARDLHDRIGQSLTYLAFELDRVVRTAEKGNDVLPALENLRGDVRGVIREVRDTLYDLRTDVSEDQDVTDTMNAYLQRVSERSGLQVTMRTDESARLALPQEREIWRIAKEAVTNVERHAQATKLSISWQCDGKRALLVVSDNGVGFAKGVPTRLDSYGIVGMRERAASIGAKLDVESSPGQGTSVRVLLEPT